MAISAASITHRIHAGDWRARSARFDERRDCTSSDDRRTKLAGNAADCRAAIEELACGR